MTRDEAAENIWAMRRFRREVTASPEAAKQALREAGIMTDDGKISDPYKELFNREQDECIEGCMV